ncbi:MAG TPA: glycosyltransferase family 2 protein [Candidatus Binataceae bacterium]|nr:glycosyltransferase family 2 protein [Candidatus Binataceae bacterium]
MDLSRPGPEAGISILIPARNEEKNIEKCLRTLAWSDDVWVVDSNSSDRTVEIAQGLGAKVAQFRWDGQGPRKKNWALKNIPWKHEWVLIVDADEEVTPPLAEEIKRVCANTDKAGFQIRYDYYFLGKALRHGDPLWKFILMRHAVARYETVNVPDVTGYDVELHEQPIVNGQVGRLRNKMIHRDNDDLHHFFARHNIYSDWEALLLTKYGDLNGGEVVPRLFGDKIQRRRWLKRTFLKTPGKPFVYFLYSYIGRLGFLDGRPGFIYQVLKSCYWYQVSAKRYEIRLLQRS